jgi:hypothetical protein
MRAGILQTLTSEAGGLGAPNFSLSACSDSDSADGLHEKNAKKWRNAHFPEHIQKPVDANGFVGVELHKSAWKRANRSRANGCSSRSDSALRLRSKLWL